MALMNGDNKPSFQVKRDVELPHFDGYSGNRVTSMRLEAKRFIPFEFPANDPNLDHHGFTKGETAQHVEYPEHCNIPTVIHVNPLKHMLAVQTVEVDGKSELQITLVPMDDNL